DAGDQGAAGRGLRPRRIPARRAGRVRRVRRWAAAVPCAHPRPQLREPPGRSRAGDGGAHRRRGGRGRERRPRDGRCGPVSAAGAAPDAEGPILSGEARAVADRLVAKYPDRRSALLPLLYLVQSEAGWVPPQGLREVAELLGLKTAEVEAVATFYTMVKLHPCGRYVLSICTNPSCALAGGQR